MLQVGFEVSHVLIIFGHVNFKTNINNCFCRNLPNFPNIILLSQTDFLLDPFQLDRAHYGMYNSYWFHGCRSPPVGEDSVEQAESDWGAGGTNGSGLD